MTRPCKYAFSLPLSSSHINIAMADVEMKKQDEKKEDEKKEDVKTPPPPPTPLAEIKSNVALIDKAVSTLEPRFTHRVLRSLTTLRKRTDPTVLRNAVEEIYPKGEYQVCYGTRINLTNCMNRQRCKEIPPLVDSRIF